MDTVDFECVSSFVNQKCVFVLPQVDLGPEDEFIVLACDGIWYDIEFNLSLLTRVIFACFRVLFLQGRQKEHCCG